LIELHSPSPAGVWTGRIPHWPGSSQGLAALRDFSPARVRSGSKRESVPFGPMSASHRLRTSHRIGSSPSRAITRREQVQQDASEKRRPAYSMTSSARASSLVARRDRAPSSRPKIDDRAESGHRPPHHLRTLTSAPQHPRPVWQCARDEIRARQPGPGCVAVAQRD